MRYLPVCRIKSWKKGCLLIVAKLYPQIESQNKADKILKKMEQKKPSKLVISFNIDPFPISQIGTQKQLQVLDIFNLRYLNSGT